MRAFLAVTLLVPSSAPAATWTVLPDGTGDFPDIATAFAAAADGDEILLGDGEFSGPGNRGFSFGGKALTLRSASGNASACVIDASRHYGSTIYLKDGEGSSSVIADLTLSGGGVRIQGASPTIHGAILHSRQALISDGGSVRLEDSVLRNGSNLLFQNGATPVVTGCVLEAGVLIESRGRVRVFDGSIAMEDCVGSGEGLVFLVNSSGTLRGCDFGDMPVWSDGDGVSVLMEECRVAGSWGGVNLDGSASTFVVRDCTIVGNGYRGIGIGGLDSHVTVERCEIRGNDNWGVYAAGQIDVRDCFITGNRSGGVYAVAARTFLDVTGCTIASNGRTWGGAIALGPGVSGSVRHSILWGNCSSTGALARVNSATLELACVTVESLLVDGDGTLLITGDVLEEDPLFCEPIDCAAVPSAAGDYRLREDSPALAHDCGAMGSQGEGCSAVSVEAASWGTVKALYR